MRKTTNGAGGFAPREVGPEGAAPKGQHTPGPWVFFPMQHEVGVGNGRYAWRWFYVRCTDHGHTLPPMSRCDCQEWARSEGGAAQFFDSEDDARSAMRAATGGSGEASPASGARARATGGDK